MQVKSFLNFILKVMTRKFDFESSPMTNFEAMEGPTLLLPPKKLGYYFHLLPLRGATKTASMLHF